MNDEDYFVKYRALFDQYKITKEMYMFDMIEGILRGLSLLE